MRRRVRLIVFLGATAVVAGFYIASALDLPAFGGDRHPYRDLAIPAAVQHHTANVVASVTFDQRGIDTLIEETIMLASVVGVAALLRPARGEAERKLPATGRIPDSTQLIGYLMLPLTLLIGADLIAHGHVTPGGGFQGGVVLATGIHIIYVTGSFRAVERAGPVGLYRVAEAVGAGAFVCLALGAILATGSFMANFVAHGTFAQLFSGGTVPLFNVAVGVEIAASVVVLVVTFLDQEILVRQAAQR